MQNHISSSAVAALAIATALGGCRSYEPRPLALDRTQADFLSRSLDGATLADFHAGLRGPGGEPPVFDPSDGLSLAEAEAIALVMNPGLRAERLAAGVTLASATNAGRWRDPSLGVDLSRIVGGAGGGIEAMFTLGLTLPLSGRLEAEKALASAEHHAELARIAAEEWRLVSTLRRAWAQRVSLVAETDASRDILARVAQVLAVVDRMQEAGEIARIEARLLKIEEMRLRAELRELEAAVEASTHGIDSILGLPPGPDRRLLGGFTAFDPLARGDRDEVLARAARSNGDLSLARARYEVAERRLAQEIRATWPDLQLGPGYGEMDGDTQAVLGIGVTLPVFDGNARGIAEAEANRDLVRAQAETMLERVLGEVIAAESRLASAAARRELIESELVPLVDTQYAEAREVARLGEVNTLVLLESLKAQLDARRRLIGAMRDEALAAIEIAELAGPPAAAPSEGEAES